MNLNEMVEWIIYAQHIMLCDEGVSEEIKKFLVTITRWNELWAFEGIKNRKIALNYALTLIYDFRIIA